MAVFHCFDHSPVNSIFHRDQPHPRTNAAFDRTPPESYGKFLRLSLTGYPAVNERKGKPGRDAERSLEQITEGFKPINEELKTVNPDLKWRNALVRDLEQRRRTIPAATLNKIVAEINALIAHLDDGKAVFYKDIGKEFLHPDGNLADEIMRVINT